MKAEFNINKQLNRASPDGWQPQKNKIMTNKLQAVKMGQDNENLNDIKNHRIRIEFTDMKDVKVLIDFSAWNQPLKAKKGYRYSKRVTILCDSQYQVKEIDGGQIITSYYRYPILNEFYNLSYTKDNILKIVNFYSKVKYNELNIISR